MDKFLAVNLSPLFNAGRANQPLEVGGPPPWREDAVETVRSLPGGPQTLWGIPFELAPAEGDAKCWVLLGTGSQGTVTIPLSGTAIYLVFVHFCNTSPKDANLLPGMVTRPGEHLADYVLVYGDGSQHRQPIRRQFEVNQALTLWGQYAFGARPHMEAVPVSWRGPYEGIGWGGAQTGVRGHPAVVLGQYWLYALPNPHPDRELSAVRLEPTGADRLVVAALTLYHGKTHPLRHRRLESLRLTLPPGQEALSKDVEATIDLGIIARKYAVPAFDAEAWLREVVQGWGEEARPEGPSPVLLLDVTASPDATLTVAGHQVAMAQVYEQGKAQSSDGQLRVEFLTPGKTWVHVTVEDASTGKATPVRVHFRAPDGRYFPPYGHRHEVNNNWFEDYGGDLKLGDTQYAYVDGHFQIELPVGEVYVEVAKGFEYQPVRERVVIQPGQRELKLRLQRPIDLRQKGWVTADTHVHFLSPQTAWLEAKGEGLNLVNLLASQWGDLFTNVADITGDVSGVSRDDTLIWVGTENRQHLLGHMSLLGVKGSPVFPMCASGPHESYLGDPVWASMAEWADRCREREGVVVLPHFPVPYCEAVADIVLGKIDAVEIRDISLPTLDTFGTMEWYRFLNCGYRLAAVGGTDKMRAGIPVGGVRTYAFLGEEEFTFANWGKAVRAGRTFNTTGPIVGLMVEGRVPGDEIRLPAGPPRRAGGGTLEVEAWAQSVLPFHVLQVVANGRVVAQKEVAEGTKSVTLKAQVRLEGSGWVAARCQSQLKVWWGWPMTHMAAHTSPVYVVAGGEELFSPSDATYMLTLLDGGLTWLDTLSIPADPERQSRIRKVFEDAQASLHRRLHAAGQAH